MSPRDRPHRLAATRRERRALERAARSRPPAGPPGPGGRLSGAWPIGGISAVAVVGALILIVVLSGGLPGGPVTVKPPRESAPLDQADGRALGRKDAPVTMEIWSDFQCPACGLMARESEPVAITDYVVPGRLRIVYRDFAFLGRESSDAAAAARCAGEQGRFWPYHDHLFANQRGENLGAFDRAHLDAIATAIGLDAAAFAACYEAGATRSAVEQETSEGRAVGVSQTPTLVIDGQSYPGAPPYNQLREILDAALDAASPSPAPAATPASSL